MATFRGGKGNDTYNGTADPDLIYGGLGGDVLRGNGGNDRIFGEDGGDRLEGGDGEDLLDGGNGEDLLFGGGGNDELLGGTGEDRLDGGEGQDRLRGGTGNDFISGGNGTDVAYYAGNLADYSISTSGGVTTIIDLKSKADGNDGIDTLTGVERLVFKGGTIFYLTPNQVPVAGNDSFSAPENGTVTGNVLTNDTDADGDPTSVSAVNGSAAAVGSTITLTSGALLRLNADGSYTYDSNGAFEGLDDSETGNDSFQYTVSDGNGGTSTATVTITVNGSNDAPVSSGNDSASGSEDDASIGGTVPVATDVDVETLTYRLVAGSVLVNGDAAPDGTVTVAGDGSYSYTPSDQDLNDGESRVVSFQYIASDGTVVSTPASVTITVTGSNDAPALVTGGSVTGSVAELANNAAGENATLLLDQGAFAFTDVDANDTHSVASITPANDGYYGLLSATVDPATRMLDWKFEVQDSAIDGLAAGQVVTQTYTIVIEDAAGEQVSRDVTVTITGAADNAAPVSGGAASASGSENDSSIGGTVPTATDGDGDAVTYQLVSGSVRVNGVAAPNSTVTFNANGTYSYTPGAADQALGASDTRTITFQYRATDGTDVSDAALVTITVEGANDAPVNSMPTSYAATEDTSRKLSGLSINDVDAGSAMMTVTLSVESGMLTATTNGIVGVSGSGTGSLEVTGTVAQINAFLANISTQPTYTPVENTNGPVALTMTTSDGTLSDEDSRDINIVAVNDAPTNLSLSGSSVPEGIPGAVVGVLSAEDVDGDSLTYSIVSGLDGDKFTIVGNELRVAASPLDYEQATQLSVKVQVRDPSGGTSIQTFVISVEDRNELQLTTSADTIPGAATNDLIIGTSTTLNHTDQINGGEGFDQLLLYNGGTFDLRNLSQFTGIEEVRIANYSSSYSDLYLRAGEQISIFVTNSASYSRTFLNTGQVNYSGGDSTDYIYANNLSNTSWNTANVLNGGNGHDVLYVYGSSTGTTDLRSATISNVEQMGVFDGRVLVDADAIAGFSYIYGNSWSKLATEEAVFDLTNKTVQTVFVTSENATGTLFKVNSLATAFQIVGGAGDDTIQAIGFSLTAEQREAIFATSLIEHIVQGGVTYDAPAADPSIIKLTTGSDVIPAGAPDSVTVNTSAASLNSGDNLNAGATGTDVLQLYGSGTFYLPGLAGFSGFEEIRAINYTNDTQALYLRDGVSTTVTGVGAGYRQLFLSTGAVTFTGGDGSDQIYANWLSSTSWNTANVLNGGNGYDYLYINSSSTGTTDLRSATISNVEQMGVFDAKVLVDADAIVGFNYIYGNSGSKLATDEAVFDLTNKTVQTVFVTSDNATGTLFKVNSLATAFQIVGGAGDDTIQAIGFSLTAEQREAIFATSLIEHIVQGGVTYDAPAADPSIIKLTTGSDVIPAGAPDSVTVNTNAASLTSGDNLNAGATGTDILQLYGSGTFNLRSLAGFSGFEEIRAINYTNDSQSVHLRDGVSATITGVGAGFRQLFLSTGAVTFTGGDGSDQIYANWLSSTSWNTANVLNGGNGHDVLYVYGSSTGTTDLRSATINNVEQMGVFDAKVLVDADAIAGFNYIYGNSGSKLATEEAVFDLTNKTVQTVSVTSDNATGTLFKVNSLATAFQIVGGAGDDTIQAFGFNFSADQRAALFAGGQIEVVIDSTGIYGSGGANDLQAAAGGRTIFGGGGNDTIRSGAGNDTLYGGSGGDRFVFGDTAGIDSVMDFEIEQAGELIDLSAVSEIDDFADLLANHLTEVAGNAVISWSGGTITFQGVQPGDLSSGDFLF